jgi:hypothetical protein
MLSHRWTPGGVLERSSRQEQRLATPNYAYEKRQRELAKKRKAEEKRQRKQSGRDDASTPNQPDNAAPAPAPNSEPSS